MSYKVTWFLIVTLCLLLLYLEYLYWIRQKELGVLLLPMTILGCIIGWLLGQTRSK